MKNLIVTHHNGDISNNWDKITRFRLFLKSLSDLNEPSIDLVLFSDHIEIFREIGKEFTSLNIIYVEDLFEKNGNASVSRFICYLKFLPLFKKKYQKIIHCDCMDVCFLTNPFPLINKKLLVCEESDDLLFKDESINCAWADPLPDSKKELFYNTFIICDGFIASCDIDTFINYSMKLLFQYEVTPKNDTLFEVHADQPLTNYLARTVDYVTVLPLRNNIVRHLLRVREKVTPEYLMEASIVHFTMINNNSYEIKDWLCSKFEIDGSPIVNIVYDPFTRTYHF